MPPNFSLNRFGDVKRDFILTTPHHFRSSMLKCLGKIALLTLVSTRLRNRICFAWSRKRGLKVISQGLAYECLEIHNAIFVPGFTCPSLHIRLSARYTSQQIKLLDLRLLPIIPAVVSTFMAQGHRVPAFNCAVISSSPFSPWISRIFHRSFSISPASFVSHPHLLWNELLQISSQIVLFKSF